MTTPARFGDDDAVGSNWGLIAFRGNGAESRLWQFRKPELIVDKESFLAVALRLNADTVEAIHQHAQPRPSRAYRVICATNRKAVMRRSHAGPEGRDIDVLHGFTWRERRLNTNGATSLLR